MPSMTLSNIADLGVESLDQQFANNPVTGMTLTEILCELQVVAAAAASAADRARQLTQEDAETREADARLNSLTSRLVHLTLELTFLRSGLPAALVQLDPDNIYPEEDLAEARQAVERAKGDCPETDEIHNVLGHLRFSPVPELYIDADDPWQALDRLRRRGCQLLETEAEVDLDGDVVLVPAYTLRNPLIPPLTAYSPSLSGRIGHHTAFNDEDEIHGGDA